MASLMQDPYLNQPCECGMGKFVEPKSGQEWTLVCSDCEKVLFCYTPMPHQALFHADKAKFRLYAGGRKSRSRL